jgi:hypothetical protein
LTDFHERRGGLIREIAGAKWLIDFDTSPRAREGPKPLLTLLRIAFDAASRIALDPGHGVMASNEIQAEEVSSVPDPSTSVWY